MEDRVEQHAGAAEHDLLLAAVHLGDPVGLAGEQLGREVAERADHLRLDQLDLAEEVALAGVDLLGLRDRGCREDGTSGRSPRTRRRGSGRSRRGACRAAARRHRRTARPACPRGSPGASPTNIRSAVGEPEPKTTWVRVARAGSACSPRRRRGSAASSAAGVGSARQWPPQPQLHRSSRRRRSPRRGRAARLLAGAVAAKTENCRFAFAAPQSGHGGVSSSRTSSSKCDSQLMQTYS